MQCGLRRRGIALAGPNLIQTLEILFNMYANRFIGRLVGNYGIALCMCISCCTIGQYVPPDSRQPSALIKFRFSVVDTVPRSDFYLRISLQTDDASWQLIEDDLDSDADPSHPIVPMYAATVTETAKTFRMELEYRWLVEEMDYQTFYHRGEWRQQPAWTTKERRKGCRAYVTFQPQADWSYLLDYTALEQEKCQIAVYRQEFDIAASDAKKTEIDKSWRLLPITESRESEALPYFAPMEWGRFYW